MLIIRPDAEEDLNESFDWYTSKSPQLGKLFLNEVETIFQKLDTHPEMYPKIFDDIRRALCKKFPYAIYFIERQSTLSILAVLHQRRNPAIWQQRYKN